MIATIKREIENLIYPELRPYERADRARLLKKASETQLDVLEWLGILVGLVIVVGVTRYSAFGLGLVDRVAIAAVNFLLALPLLILTVGPFLIRRTRRGLRSQLQKPS
jgi:hypothetical protein